MGDANGMFIGGEWVPGATGKTEPILNPATGETLVEVAVGSSEDVDRAVTAARDAFGDWMDSTPGERAGMLLKLADRLEENKQYLSDLESANVGKPAQYVGLDLDFSIDNPIFSPQGGPIDDESFERADELEVHATRLKVAAVEDVLAQKLLALNEQQPDYSSVLEIARSLREQIDWDDVRKRTQDAPFAKAFFTLLDELEIVQK